MKIINQTLAKISELKKNNKKFLSELIYSILSNPGKVNFRNLSRYSNYHEKTISRNYKSGFINFLELNNSIIENIDISEKIIATDCSFIKKSGQKTYGLGKFYNSKTGKAEQGLEISFLALIDIKDNSAYALDVKQTPSKLGSDSRIDFYAKQLIQNKNNFLGAKYISADGYYSKTKFVDAVINSNLNMIGKLRKDSNLKYLSQSEKNGKRGAPRKYEGKVNLEKPRFDYVKDLKKGSKLYSKIVWSVRFKRKIRISYVNNGKNKSLYFSTDINLSAEKIYQYYRSRFQIEFLFRDTKSYLGLDDCMSTDKKALDFHFNICMTTLNMAKVDDRLKRNQRKPFSIINYKRRVFNEKIIKLFLYKFELEPEFVINHHKYTEILNYGVISA